MMILGIHSKAPNIQEIFMHNAVGWLGTKVKIIRYEDVIKNLKNLESIDAQAFFFRLLNNCDINTIPENWRERIKVGSDRKQSSTARENLSGTKYDAPDALPVMQKRMVDHAAPGLRELLGYRCAFACPNLCQSGLKEAGF